MTKGRLEAFSDGVIAIIITIMVLELRPPREAALEALIPLLPTFLSYVLSFVTVGIYWNNHHHLLQAAKQVDGRALWANLHLLFWLSLVPFITAWMGDTSFATVPVAIYGAVLLLAAIAFTILANILISIHDKDSVLVRALENNRKAIVSMALYAASIPIAFVHSLLAFSLFVIVALMWLIPDRRIEEILVR